MKIGMLFRMTTFNVLLSVSGLGITGFSLHRGVRPSLVRQILPDLE